jgi:hypothetical protein
MGPWEAGSLSALATMTLLSVIRWWFNDHRTVMPAMASGFAVVLLATMAMVAPSALALSGGQGYNVWPSDGESGYVAIQATDCEYVQQQISQGGSNAGNPWIATYASVDGGSGCSNHSFQAAPGALSTRQDLYFWTGSVYAVCNPGPRISNGPVAYGAGGYYTHSLSTSYGFDVGGYPPCHDDTWFVPLSYNYYNTYPGGPWDGGTVMQAQLYVWIGA